MRAAAITKPSRNKKRQFVQLEIRQCSPLFIRPARGVRAGGRYHKTVAQQKTPIRPARNSPIQPTLHQTRPGGSVPAAAITKPSRNRIRQIVQLEIRQHRPLFIGPVRGSRRAALPLAPPRNALSHDRDSPSRPCTSAHHTGMPGAKQQRSQTTAVRLSWKWRLRMIGNDPSPFLLSVRHALRPADRGVLGMVDELLKLCHRQGIDLRWHDGRYHARSIGGGLEDPVELPISSSVLRAILARLAVLCNERNPGSVSPYGGHGELTIGADPAAVCRVTFTNTQDVQRLAIDANPKVRSCGRRATAGTPWPGPRSTTPDACSTMSLCPRLGTVLP